MSYLITLGRRENGNFLKVVELDHYSYINTKENFSGSPLFPHIEKFESFFCHNKLSPYKMIKQYFGDNIALSEKHLWRLIELFEQFFRLKKSVEVLRNRIHLQKYATPAESNQDLANLIEKQLSEVVAPEIYRLCNHINDDDYYQMQIDRFRKKQKNYH